MHTAINTASSLQAADESKRIEMSPSDRATDRVTVTESKQICHMTYEYVHTVTSEKRGCHIAQRQRNIHGVAARAPASYDVR